VEITDATKKLSAFVTGGALLGIKLIGRNAEHVVALDAHAMDDRADDRAGLDGLGRTCRSCIGGWA
jgi:hypothetical protein